jgi:hypothetical protein
MRLLIVGLVAGGVCVASSGRIAGAPVPPARSLGHSSFAVADFDGDSRPDIAITKMEARGAGYVYWLELDLSTERESQSPFDRTGLPVVTSTIFGLHLTPRDVDGDHDLDIVVTAGLARQPVAVWINDGQGRFEEGDLAAYPALTELDGFSLSPQSRQEIAQAVYDEGRRTRLAQPAGSGRQPPAPRPSLRDVHPLEMFISRFRADQLPARAPPSPSQNQHSV